MTFSTYCYLRIIYQEKKKIASIGSVVMCIPGNLLEQLYPQSNNLT